MGRFKIGPVKDWFLESIAHEPQCVFEDGPAVARFSTPEGCVALRDVRHQNLCLHHMHKATPIGEMILIACYLRHSPEPCELCGGSSS